MNPQIRDWLVKAGSVLLAVWLGWSIAGGSVGMAAFAAVVSLAVLLVRLTRLQGAAILLGLLLVGYVVGNRGFAQILPVPFLPLFPAELGLAVCLGWLVIQTALRRTKLWRRDALNWTILAWLALGTARVLIDTPRYGLVALRDYAMIYYVGFFLVAQHFATQVRARNYLVGCLGLGVVALLPVYFLVQEFPQFFFSTLTLRGVPLIYLKGDLALTFLSCGAIIVFFLLRGRWSILGWWLAAAMFLTVLASDSRASLAGGIIATVWLLVTRRWAFPALEAGLAGLAFAGLVAASVLGNTSAETRLQALTDRAASFADVSHAHTYLNDDDAYKADNNRFRLVWWRTVAKETLSQGPVLGLGFGYDLAKGFLQAYDPEIGEDFSVRSPHSIIFSALGRMGVLGLAVFIAMIGAMGFRTWHALHDSSTDLSTVGLWCAAWVILTSACFGVVLEGPMGAVVFWSVLGLANGSEATTKGADGGNPLETENTSEAAQA
jgi:O-antigen ligase